MVNIQALVEDIVYRNDQNGYTVARVKTDDGLRYVVVGELPFLAVGEKAAFSGEVVEHRDYGAQIKVESYEMLMPEKKSDIERYLASGIIKGIGPATAKLIVKRFGSETLDILEANPDRLTEIAGIGSRRARQIGESFAINIAARRTMMFLQNLGLTPNMSTKVFSRFGDMTEEVIKQNPYRLADEVENVGFKTADAIAMRLGFTMESRVRLLSGVRYVLNEASSGEGHTYLPMEKLAKESERILNAGYDNVSGAISELVISKQLIVEGENAYLPKLYDAETETARLILSLMRSVKAKSGASIDIESLIEKYEAETGVTLGEEQKTAVSLSAVSGISIITGGPGTGKTTSIRCLIKLMSRFGKVELCAPTGRASKRMSEATGREARTIHRMLEYSGDEEGFGKNGEDPLDADAVIVDEASMIDIFLMRALLRAIKPGTRLVFVGDVDQLPSVGAGNVLRDMIDSGAVAVCRLTEIYRQAAQSNIVMNAHRINKGQYPVLINRNTDFFIERKQTPAEAAQAVVALVSQRLPKYLDVNAVRDIQVMAPMKRGDAGVYELNRLLQASLNPPSNIKSEMKRGDTLLRVGDKVMQTKNNYDIEWTKNGDSGTGVFNGDIGYIVGINSQSITARVEFDDGRVVDYEESGLNELELSYCVSVHKSQGSEFEAVVMPIISGPPMLMTRNLLYTAVTRAKRLVVIVGREESINRMVDNNHIETRYSSLAKRLST